MNDQVKAEQKVLKAERTIRRRARSWKKKAWNKFVNTYSKVLGYILFGMFIGYFLFKFVYTHTFTLQTPLLIKPIPTPTVKIYSPIPKGYEPVKQTPKVATPSAKLTTEKETVLASLHGDILWKIYGLETSWGKNDYCRNNSLGFGGFGVKESPTSIACYPTFSKAVERADYWLTKNGIDRDVASTLCKWNEGIDYTGCQYYKSYLSLK